MRGSTVYEYAYHHTLPLPKRTRGPHDAEGEEKERGKCGEKIAKESTRGFAVGAFTREVVGYDDELVSLCFRESYYNGEKQDEVKLAYE